MSSLTDRRTAGQKKVGDVVVYGLFNAFGIVCFVWAISLVMPDIESKFYPTLENFVVTDYHFDSNDVIVTGTVVKARNCVYIPPWRSQSLKTGQMLHIVHEPVDSVNWDKGKITTKFRVVNGRNEPFRLFAEHQCHPIWRVFSDLGEHHFEKAIK